MQTGCQSLSSDSLAVYTPHSMLSILEAEPVPLPLSTCVDLLMQTLSCLMNDRGIRPVQFAYI